MKPNFALNITDTAIGLLHRTSQGWLEVGSTPFDSPDLEEALGYLRSSALGLSPHGITTKLVLPPSQILYTEVEAPGPDKASREAQIRKALEGRTPYAVDDLVFDWWGTGATVQVAVVARETLEEAEAFAETHRFSPVSFVTIPAEGQFAGEPWFGTTKHAATILTKGQRVRRDQDPVKVITRRAPEAEPVQEPAVDEKAEATHKAANEIAAKQEAQAAAKVAAEAEVAAKAQAAREAEAAADAEALRKAEAARAEMELRAQELAQAEAKRLVEEAEKTKAAMQERERSKAALIEAERKRAASPEAKAEAASATFEGVTAPGIAETKETAPPPSAPNFASRRREDEGAAASTSPSAPPATAAPIGAPPALGPAAPTVNAKVQAPAAAKPPAPKVGAPVVVEKPKSGGPAAPTITSVASSKPAATTKSPGPVLKPVVKGTEPGAGNPLNGTAAFVQGAKPKLAAAEPVKTTDADSAAVRIPGKAAALSRFKSKVAERPVKPQDTAKRSDAGMGEMGAKLAARRGKPRFLGLILTLVLLALLAAVATWSSVYLSRDEGAGPAPVQQADATPDVNAVPDTEPTPSEAIAALEPTVEPEPVEVAQPEVPAPAGPGPDVAPVDAAAQITGPGRGAEDEIFLAGTDTQPPAFDPVALPRPQSRPDIAPDAPMPPPPFGTEYEFDADGRIMATQNGVIMPDGFWLIAARPAVMPPPRPAEISDPVAPEAAATPPPAPPGVTPPEVAQEGGPPRSEAASASTAGVMQQEGNGPSFAFEPDATVESRRPSARPASLDAAPVADPAADDPAQAEDGAALTEIDPALQRLTRKRPPARPNSVVVAAEEARKAAASASLIAQAADAEQARQGTMLAVALSPRPAARPQDFSGAVAAAVSAAARETSRRQASAPAPTAEPEEQHEPEVKASAAPRIPTRASVAQQATFKNAINLSKTNLIGVYGSDKKRYALIRSSSGRYSKVRVGDRVDGGTVAAITRNEVRYKKGNRMLTLAMPKG